MKDMRWRFLVVWLTCLLAPAAHTQSGSWQDQYAGLPAGRTTGGLLFSAVDSLVCWAALCDDSGGPAVGIRTTNGGESWISFSVPGANGLDASGISAVDSLRAWIVFEEWEAGGGGVYATTDGGTTWIHQPTPSRAYGEDRFIKFFDGQNGLLGGGPVGDRWEIYTTSDGGAHWTQVPAVPPAAPHEGALIPCPTASYGNSFWFTSSQGSLYRTTDRGRTWSVSRNIFPGAQWIDVAFKDSLNGLVTDVDQLGPDLKIRRTTDGGATYSDVNKPAGLTCAFVTYVPGTQGTYLVSGTANPWRGTLGGSAYTVDDGATWSIIDSVDHGRSAFAGPSAGWIAGDEDSLFRWNGSLPGAPLLDARDAQGHLPASFTLSQNYPNPFNPSTTIRYGLPERTHVTLMVFNALGEHVATIVDGEMDAGDYGVQYDASHLASGVYLYQLHAGAFTETRRLMLLK